MATKDSLTAPKADYLPMFELLEYIPLETLNQFIAVLWAGAAHYGKDNWRTPPYLPKQELYRSALRHLKAMYDGHVINNDNNQNVYHAANLMCNAMFLLTGDIEGWWDTGEPKEYNNEDSEEDEPEETNVNALHKQYERFTGLSDDDRARLVARLQQKVAPVPPVISTPPAPTPVQKKTETVVIPDGNVPRMSARKLNPVAPSQQSPVAQQQATTLDVQQLEDLLGAVLGEEGEEEFA